MQNQIRYISKLWIINHCIYWNVCEWNIPSVSFLRWTSSSIRQSLACGPWRQLVHVAKDEKKNEDIKQKISLGKEFLYWKDWRVYDTDAYPRVLQCLSSSNPLSRIVAEHLIDEIFGLRGNRVPLRRRVLYWNIQDGRSVSENIEEEMMRSEDDSRHKTRLWFERRAYAGLHPRMAGSRLARCTVSPLGKAKHMVIGKKASWTASNVQICMKPDWIRYEFSVKKAKLGQENIYFKLIIKIQKRRSSRGSLQWSSWPHLY